MKREFAMSIVLVSFMFSFTSCWDETESKKKTEDLGKQAAVEFCTCYKKDTKEKCLDALTSKYYKVDYISKEFIDAFNNQSTCGVKLEKIYLSEKVNDYEFKIVEW